MENETQLARQIAEGNEQALELFYERYADSLYAFIFHHLNGTKEDAEDLWQESLLAAVRGMDAYRGQSQLFTWCCGIARRKIADYYRRLGRPTEAVLPHPPEDLESLVDEAAQPEDSLQARSTRVQVVATLQALPPEYRQALISRYADENSVDEVARLLGKSYKATESLLTRARSAFQSFFLASHGE